jgi:hypothetical protein
MSSRDPGAERNKPVRSSTPVSPVSLVPSHACAHPLYRPLVRRYHPETTAQVYDNA